MAEAVFAFVPIGAPESAAGEGGGEEEGPGLPMAGSQFGDEGRKAAEEDHTAEDEAKDFAFAHGGA